MEASGKAEEQEDSSRYTREDLEDFDAQDCGGEKLLRLCGVSNSLAEEMKLRDEHKSELEVAQEFSRMQKSVPPSPVIPESNMCKRCWMAFPAITFGNFTSRELGACCHPAHQVLK